jgi:hypothetical protein
VGCSGLIHRRFARPAGFVLSLAALEVFPQRRRQPLEILALGFGTLRHAQRLRLLRPCGKDRRVPARERRPLPARGPARCRSSVVEHPLGKGEVVSSILTGSTIKTPINRGFVNQALPSPPPLKHERFAYSPTELGENLGILFDQCSGKIPDRPPDAKRSPASAATERGADRKRSSKPKSPKNNRQGSAAPHGAERHSYTINDGQVMIGRTWPAHQKLGMFKSIKAASAAIGCRHG